MSNIPEPLGRIKRENCSVQNNPEEARDADERKEKEQAWDISRRTGLSGRNQNVDDGSCAIMNMHPATKSWRKAKRAPGINLRGWIRRF